MKVGIDMTEQELVKWINQLLQEHKIYKFYQSKEWRSLRADILHKYHNECYKCRQVGKITKADTVHHVYHVKDYPQYALSEYVALEGNRILNLIPLCNACHNIEHPEKFGKTHKRKKEINDEKW